MSIDEAEIKIAGKPELSCNFFVGSDKRGRLYFMPFSYASIIFLNV